MRRGTTPTYDITISDMKNVEDVCLAFEQTSSGVMLAKHVSDNDGRSGFTSTGCYFTLSQEETAMFSKGSLFCVYCRGGLGFGWWDFASRD